MANTCNYSLYKKININEPIGKEYPNEFAKVIILLESNFLNETSCNQLQFKTHQIQFNSNIEIIVGLADCKFRYMIDQILLSMRESEKFEIICKFSFVENSFVETNDFDFKFSITLFKIQFSQKIYNLNSVDKLERTLKLKECGTVAFLNREYNLAFNNFSRALKYILCIEEEKNELPHLNSNLDTIDENIIKNNDIYERKNLLKLQLYLNLSACQLKNKSNLKGAIENCTKVIQTDKSLVKAWFRRGEAYLKLGYYQSAIEDFSKALEINPNNNEILEKLKESKHLNKKDEAVLANGLKNMFK